MLFRPEAPVPAIVMAATTSLLQGSLMMLFKNFAGR